MLEMLVDLRALFGSMVTFPDGKMMLLKEARFSQVALISEKEGRALGKREPLRARRYNAV